MENQEISLKINLPQYHYDDNPLFKNCHTVKGLINMLLIIAQTCEECQASQEVCL